MVKRPGPIKFLILEAILDGTNGPNQALHKALKMLPAIGRGGVGPQPGEKFSGLRGGGQGGVKNFGVRGGFFRFRGGGVFS